ncbi:unnamed protein product [Phytophthora lilii]|uniref:Unnamed protein product n=1 Tax=Phytophthora lilii TaxID=2077276 RepID=A0A9W6TIB3_9STRA|nr:unnamed protein product [Phytophthora lilii]
MANTSDISPNFVNGELVASEAKLPHQARRRSHRLSITNRRTNSVSEGSITHVDVFLGSLTATSEQLASSFVENTRKRGAEATMRSLEAFNPNHYLDPNSVYRSPSRLAVFVVSTHVAGKPSPNAENFLQWLREAPIAVRPPAAEPLRSEEVGVPTAISTPPKSSHPGSREQSPRKLQLNSSNREGELHRHHSLTDALRASFRVNWRHPFGGGETSLVVLKPEGPLLGVQYAVFGVGNSIYRTYNATAKYVDLRLHELGAVRVCSVGLGDVSKGIENVFAKWEAQLLQILHYRRSDTSISAPATAREPAKLPARPSLPCSIGSAGISIAEILAGEPAMPGPTPSDLLPKAGMPGRQHQKVYHRRYSSATTMIIARRGNADPDNTMPPLTDRR